MGSHAFDGSDLLPIAGIPRQRLAKIESEINTEFDVLGAKNLLPVTASSVVSNGITFTVNSDGSVNVNGTASATAILNLVSNYPLAKGKYILSGCPANGGLETYNMFINNSGGSSGNIARDYGAGVEFELLSDQQILVGIGIAQGQTVNFTYFPMIRPASIRDDTFVPFAKTNKELTDDVTTLKSSLANLNSALTQKVDKNWTGLETAQWKPCSSFTMPPNDWTELLVIVKLKSGNNSSFRLTNLEYNLTSNGGVIYILGGVSGTSNVGVYIHKSANAFDAIVVFENNVNVTTDSTYKSYYKA